MKDIDYRARAVYWAVQVIRTPYRWGGNHPQDPGVDYVGDPWARADPSRGGFDCSGFILWCWNKAGVIMNDMTAWQLAHKCVCTDSPEPGDVCLYGRTRVGHVTMYLAPNLVVGANRGMKPFSDDTFRGYADRMDDRMAWVRFEYDPKYRRDFLGFAKMPEVNNGTG